jgi:hypothetical protein
MTFLCCINRIHEKNQLKLTGFVAMSPVVSGKYEYNTNREEKDAKSCNDCSIVTREAGRTQEHEKGSGPWKSLGLD